MVKLKAMPRKSIVSGFKGLIDFYVYRHSADPDVGMKGVPCARRWPRSPGHKRAPLVEAQWQAFAWAAANWNSVSPEVQEAYRQTAEEMNLTSRDLFTKSFITDYFRPGQWPDKYIYKEDEEMLSSAVVYLSATFENIPHATSTKIPWDVVSFDTGDDFDLPNSHFICPRDGRYLCRVSLLWINLTLSKTYRSVIVKNGGWSRQMSFFADPTNWLHLQATAVINCLAGDSLEAHAYHDAGAATPDIYGDNTPSTTSFEIAHIG